MFKKLRVLTLATLMVGGSMAPVLANTDATPQIQTLKQSLTQKSHARKTTREKRRAFTTKGFSLIAPMGWKRSVGKKEKYIMAFKDKVKNKFATNLNVSANPDKGVKIDSVGPALKKQFAKQFKDWTLGEDGYLTVNGQKGYYVSSKFSMSGFKIQNMQFLVKHPKKKIFYIATFTTRQKQYKDYRYEFMRALKSIKFN